MHPLQHKFINQFKGSIPVEALVKYGFITEETIRNFFICQRLSQLISGGIFKFSEAKAKVKEELELTITTKQIGNIYEANRKLLCLNTI